METEKRPINDLQKLIEIDGEKFIPLSKMSYEIKQIHWYRGIFGVKKVISENALSQEDYDLLKTWNFNLNESI